MNYPSTILYFLLVYSLIFHRSNCETNEEWNSRIENKIDILRKNDGKIILDSKKYGHNVKLQLNQTRLSFPMGTAIKASYIAACVDEGVDDEYCAFVRDNYNYVVVENAMKWPQWEPNRDEFKMDKPDKAIKWAHDNGMGARGHNLFWAVGKDSQIPNWVKPLKGDDMREAIDHRIATAVTHYDVRTYNKFYSVNISTKNII